MIDIAEVTKRFGATTAVDAISLSIGPGVCGLLGPNGAGKTTLLRMLATVAAPDEGRLRLGGLDPATDEGRVAIRRRLGYVPQHNGLHPSFSVFELVDYVAILKEMTDRRARHDEVRRVLGLVELTDVSSRKIRRLSGGMRRRVVLAQALLGRPTLLVLDEPTAGLDPTQRLRFREVVSTAAAEATVVLSTHQTDDVSALCARVVVMHEGRVRFDGTPAALAETARGRVWQADERHRAARLAWRTASGHHRNIGEAPAGAKLVEPTVEDGYLLLVGEQALNDAPA